MPKVTKSKAAANDRLLLLTVQKQAILLDPAEAEFIQYGFNKASLNRILTTANMSKGQAYYYIDGKAGLYRAVCYRAFVQLYDVASLERTSITNADSFWLQVQCMFERVVALFVNNRKLARLARGIYASSEAQTALIDLSEQLDAYFFQLIELGQTVGAIRSDLPHSFISSVLFATLRAMDCWFAEHQAELSEMQLFNINTAALGMLKALAAPAKTA